MNKEKLQNIFNDFLNQVDKLASMKSKYQNWYDDDWKVILSDDIKSECAELEYAVSNYLIDSLVYGEKE